MRAPRSGKAWPLAVAGLLAVVPSARSQTTPAADQLGSAAEVGASIHAAMSQEMAQSQQQQHQDLGLWMSQHTLGAPYTGRHQLILTPQSVELDIGNLLYQRFLSGSKLAQDPDSLAMVQRVSNRMIAVAGRTDWTWTVNLVDFGPTSAFGVGFTGDQNEAFALPGGKIGIHSGMLTVTTDENGLAALMGHEMAHAVARHMGERITELILVAGGVTVAGAVIFPVVAGIIPATAGAVGATELLTIAQNIYGMGCGGVGGTLIAGFSKTQEEEADHIGLILMAKAGYDPAKAMDFWNRLLQETARPVKPGFIGKLEKYFQVHPITAERIAKMQGLIPGVRAQYYQPAAVPAK
jgi:predicted Zn-dependent protease